MQSVAVKAARGINCSDTSRTLNAELLNMRFWIAGIIAFCLTTTAAMAAEFTCSQPKELGRVVVDADYSVADPLMSSPVVGPFKWNGNGGKYCYEIEISGPIISGDADKLEWILGGYNLVDGLPYLAQLSSPGGDVFEAMTMGRLLRTRYVKTSAACHQKVCCASACALVFYGGVAWKKASQLGLHRPSRADVREIEYTASRQSTFVAIGIIKTYLQEMEVDPSVFELMMRTPPDEVAVVTAGRRTGDYDYWAYPSSVYDWLFAKCKHEAPDVLDMCMSGELPQPSPLFDSEPTEATQFSWYKHKTTEQLKDMLSFDSSSNGRMRLGSIRELAADRELEVRTAK